ncbi:MULTISPECIES: hypothetical protein [unclassified Paenibacillus]|uniref:hypothetical protein n=1 Tax=unclassified Paenibacillus TaxID=185978 RepID=UPI00364392C0
MEKILAELFINGKVETMYILIFVIVILWLFKEVRARYIKDDETTINRIDKSLESLGVLEGSMIKYLDSSTDENKKLVKEAISKSYSHLPQRLYKDASLIMDDLKRDKIKSFLGEIRKEVTRYKLVQEKKFPIFFGESASDIVNYYWHYFRTFFIPFTMTYAHLMLIFLVIYVMAYWNQPSVQWQDKISFTLNSVSVMVLIILFITVFDIILEKKFNHSLWIWLLVTTFLVGFYLMVISQIWYISIILLLYCIFFIFFVFPKTISKRKINEIS